MATPQKFRMSRRFVGLDLLHPPQDLAEGMVTQSDNLQNIGGVFMSRPGKLGQLATKLTTGGIYALTPYLTADTSTPPVLTQWHMFACGQTSNGGGQIYIAQKGSSSAPTALLLSGFTYSDLVIGATTTHVSSVMRPFVTSDVSKTLTITTNIVFNYTDLVIGSTTTHVSSVARPFLSSDVGSFLNITGGTGFNTGAFTISSVSNGVAVLSSSAGVANSTGGNAQLTNGFTTGAYTINSVSGGVAILNSSAGTANATAGSGTMSSVVFNLNSPNVFMKQLGKFMYIVDGQSGLFRVYLPGTNTTSSYTAVQLTTETTPLTPIGATVTGSLIDAMQTDWLFTSLNPLLLNWGPSYIDTNTTFPPVLNGSSPQPSMISNPNYTGGTNHDTDPPPYGWQTGGDSMDFRSTGGIATAAYFDAGNGPSWTDWEAPNAGYTPGSNLANNARVFNAQMTVEVNNGNTPGIVNLEIIPESSTEPAGNSISSTSPVSITDLAIDSANLATVKSASSHPFVAGDIGKILTISGGSNWIPGPYVISSVTSNVATLKMAGTTGLTTAVCALVGGATAGSATLSANVIVLTDLEVAGGNESTVQSAGLYTFVAGDVGKVLTVVSGTNWVIGAATIISVLAGVATLTNPVATNTGATGGVAFLGLDNSANSWGNNNYSLQTPPSAIPGGNQNFQFTVPVGTTTTYNQIFSLTGLSIDPDFVRLRVWAPANQPGPSGVWNVNLQPLDIGIVIDALNSNTSTLHLKAKQPLTGSASGSNCLGGSYIKRDFTGSIEGSENTYTDLVIGSNTNQVSSVTRPFLFSDIGRTLWITSGSGFTISAPYITSVSNTGVATLSASAGTAASTSGHATLLNTKDFSTTSEISMGYSAPATSAITGGTDGQIPFRFGFLQAGSSTASIVWSSPVTYTADGTAFFVDISSIPAAVRKQTAILYLQIVSDLSPNINPSDLCTLGPLNAGGNLTVNAANYFYVITEVDDTTVSSTGVPTGDTVDGQIETDPSQPTLGLTPTGIAAQAQMTMPTPQNATTNYFYVYRYGGVFPDSDTVPTYRLIAKLPLWTGGQLAFPYSTYCTWNPSTSVFVDNTPDAEIFLATTMASGRNALAGLAPQAVTAWQNRVCVATGTQLNISWLVTWDQAAGLYFNAVNTPDDPYGEIKGIQISVGGNDNDNILALVPLGGILIIFKNRSIWQLTGTDATNFELSGHLTEAGLGLIAPRAWTLMQNPILPIQNVLWFLSSDGVWEYDGGDAAHPVSEQIEQLLNPALGTGTAIPASAYASASMVYHNRKFYLFIPTPAFSYTDLVIQGTNTQVTSINRPFLATDVGKTLTITGGTGFTPGTPTISSVSTAGIATLSGSAGTAFSQGGTATLPADTQNVVCYVYDTRYHGWTRYILGTWNGSAQVGITGASSLTHSVDTNDMYMGSTDGQIIQLAGNGDKDLSGSSAAAIPFATRSRGMGQEQEGFDYWLLSDVKKVYFSVTTQEAVTLTVGVSADTSFPFSLAYAASGLIDDRLRVPSYIRGRVVEVALSGSSVTPTTITSYGVELTEGRPYTR